MRERTRRGVVGTSRTHREMVRAHGDRSNGTENICGPKSSGHSAVPPLGSRSSRGPLLLMRRDISLSVMRTRARSSVTGIMEGLRVAEDDREGGMLRLA